MTAINLNLIPPSFKQHLRRMHLLQFGKNLLLVVVFYTIVIALILLGARLLLASQLGRIVDDTTLVTGGNHTVETNIMNLNTTIEQATSLEKNAYPWSTFLISFSEAIPTGVVLRSVDFGTDGTATITGVATTRGALLALQTNLVALPTLSQVDLPESLLVERQNITFTITAHLDLSQLAQP